LAPALRSRALALWRGGDARQARRRRICGAPRGRQYRPQPSAHDLHRAAGVSHACYPRLPDFPPPPLPPPPFSSKERPRPGTHLCAARRTRNRRALFLCLGRAQISPSDMPRRTDISSILIIGAGPIVIGQACEFDYSGTQALKALKAEGYRIVLVNSNPATIM